MFQLKKKILNKYIWDIIEEYLYNLKYYKIKYYVKNIINHSFSYNNFHIFNILFLPHL